MKKLCIGLLVLALLLAQALPGPALAEGEKLKIVATIFPLYDWVRQIAGDSGNVELTLLLDTGADLHNFQPTVKDIVTLSQCDLFLYVGGESDRWVDDVLETARNDHLTRLSMLDALGDRVRIEEIVEGMEHEEEEHGEEEEEEADEHVWLSLKNAQALVAKIADTLCALDAAHADAYRTNTAAYEEKLAALDRRYQEAVNAAAFDTLVFGDRFAFRYLMEDYGLSYFAAFSGCSAETEASFQTILFLANKVNELGLRAIMTLESPKTRIAETVRDATETKNQKLLSLNSMQSITSGDVAAGANYLTIMEENLQVLREALN